MIERKTPTYVFIIIVCSILIVSSLLPLVKSTSGERATITAVDNPHPQVKVGVYLRSPLTLEPNRTHKGIYLDILEQIAFLEGVESSESWELNYLVGSYNETLGMLEDDEIDLMVPAVDNTSSPEMIFSNTSVIDSWGSIYTKSDEDIDDLFDLEGKRLGVLENGPHIDGQDGIKEKVKEFDINCTFQYFQEYEDIFERVGSGEIDAGLVDRTYGDHAQGDHSLKRSPIMFDHIEFRFAFSPNGSGYIKERIDHHLSDMKKDHDSIYYESIDRYLGDKEEGEEKKADQHEFKIIPTQVSLILLVIAGALGVLGSMIITLDKKVKERTEELQEANELLKEDIAKRKKAEERGNFLLTLLRHDLKNKQMVLQGYLQILEDSDLPGSEEEMVDKALKANENSKELLQKVGLLRDIDQEEEQKVDLSKYVLNAVEKNKMKAEDEGISLKNQIEGCKVIGGSLLEEMFSNLIENSIKHADCETIKISVKEKDEDVLVRIEDDGKGVPDDMKDKIFEKNYKGPDSSGTGIGTYLTKQIADTYDGDIEVGNSDMGGARFDVILRKPGDNNEG